MTEERRRGRELLNEAQALLEVAKREQMKTALQLQRSQRKVCPEHRVSCSYIQPLLESCRQNIMNVKFTIG